MVAFQVKLKLIFWTYSLATFVTSSAYDTFEIAIDDIGAAGYTTYNCFYQRQFRSTCKSHNVSPKFHPPIDAVGFWTSCYEPDPCIMTILLSRFEYLQMLPISVHVSCFVSGLSARLWFIYTSSPGDNDILLQPVIRNHVYWEKESIRFDLEQLPDLTMESVLTLYLSSSTGDYDTDILDKVVFTFRNASTVAPTTPISTGIPEDSTVTTQKRPGGCRVPRK